MRLLNCLYFLFFLMILRPPISTLFPYTTLFRSTFRQEGLGSKPHCEVAVASPIQGPDRKSTRLNSSHSSTSYAVFCLKKKIQVATPITHARTTPLPPTATANSPERDKSPASSAP